MEMNSWMNSVRNFWKNLKEFLGRSLDGNLEGKISVGIPGETVDRVSSGAPN